MEEQHWIDRVRKDIWEMRRRKTCLVTASFSACSMESFSVFRERAEYMPGVISIARTPTQGGLQEGFIVFATELDARSVLDKLRFVEGVKFGSVIVERKVDRGGSRAPSPEK